MIDDIKRWLASGPVSYGECAHDAVDKAHVLLSWCVEQIERLRFDYSALCEERIALQRQRCETCYHRWVNPGAALPSLRWSCSLSHEPPTLDWSCADWKDVKP